MVLQKRSKQPFIKQLTNLERSAFSGKSQFSALQYWPHYRSLDTAGFSWDFPISLSVDKFLVKYKVTVFFWISEATESRKKVLFMGKINTSSYRHQVFFKSKENITVKWVKLWFRGGSWKKKKIFEKYGDRRNVFILA